MYIEGQARVRRAVDSMTRDLKKGDRLYPGDKIETDEGSKIVLGLFGKSRFDIDGAASVGIIERGVELSDGEVWAMVSERLLKADEVYEIRGRDAVAQFRDTASMKVESIRGIEGMPGRTLTMVCAERGAVRVGLANGATIDLNPKECAKIGGDPLSVERNLPVPPSAGVPKAGPLPKRHP